MTDNRPALTGAAMFAAGGFDLELPDAVVLVFDEGLMPGRSRRDRYRHPFRRVGMVSPQVAIVCAAGPGAPSAAVSVELLAAFGVRTVVVVGSAGDLNDALPVAAYSVTEAASDEGTSQHYSDNLSADKDLAQLLGDASGSPTVATVTTDAPFRHTPARLAEHRRRGALIEMELAAVFAAATVFDIRAAALVVPSDRFAVDGWQLTDPEQVREMLRNATQLAAATLSP